MSVGGLIFVLVAAAVIIVAAAGQVLAYRRGRALLTRAQLTLRLVMALLLLAVLALSLYAMASPENLLPAGMSRAERLSQMRAVTAVTVYWSAVTVLLLATMVLAVIDLRYVRAAQHRVRATMYRSLAKLEQELQAQAEAKARRQTEGNSVDENLSSTE